MELGKQIFNLYVANNNIGTKHLDLARREFMDQMLALHLFDFEILRVTINCNYGILN